MNPERWRQIEEICHAALAREPDRRAALVEEVCHGVILHDLDGQLLWHYPERPAMQRDIEAVVRSVGASGFDPFVGRKLYSLARTAGFTKINVAIERYHLVAGSIDEENRIHWGRKLEVALPLIASALGSEQAASDFTSAFMEYLGDASTLTYSVLFSVTGVRPE